MLWKASCLSCLSRVIRVCSIGLCDAAEASETCKMCSWYSLRVSGASKFHPVLCYDVLLLLPSNTCLIYYDHSSVCRLLMKSIPFTCSFFASEMLARMLGSYMAHCLSVEIVAMPFALLMATCFRSWSKRGSSAYLGAMVRPFNFCSNGALLSLLD